MSEAGEATSTTSTAAAAPSSSAPITTAAALPQAPAEAAPQDPAPKSPAGGGAPPAPAPAALVSGNPGGDAAPGTAAPASSAAVGSEDAEKKVLGESGGEDRGEGGWPLRAGARAAEHVWATPAACLGGMDQGPRGRGVPPHPGAGGRPSRRRCRTKARRSRPPERSRVRKLGVLTGGTLGGRCRAVPWRRIPRCGGERSGSRERGSRVGWKWM